MNQKLLQGSSWATILLLIILLSVGVVDFYNSIGKYGWTFKRTTIIGNYVQVETVNMAYNIIAYLVIFWLIFLLSYLTIYFRTVPKNKQELAS